MAEQGIRLPDELRAVPSRVLEEYVRARLVQFAGAFARRISPALDARLLQQAAAEAISSLPAPEVGRVALENRDLQLVFRHDCLSLGCLDPQCALCEHNPHRRCNVNFAPKYLVNDMLKAKCEAPIRVEIIDRATGVPLGEDVPDIHLEMCILDGNAYDAKCLEAGTERDEDLDACALLSNNKQSNALLLAGGAGATHTNDYKLVVGLQRGMAVLPELHVSDSSEAMLSGRKPPFRLLVRAAHRDGRKISIRHAVSEGFVVATRRTRTAGKVEIPNVDDHVSKLEHMGKETVKKLQDLCGAAAQSSVDINVPLNHINKVGEFRKLAMMAESDGHLRQKLQQVLKLSKEKWDEARDHAMRAVVADSRMRIWYADKTNMELGLLFTARLGNVDLDRPVGLLQKRSQDGTQTTMEATLMAQQTPGQREQVRQLQPQAVVCWWQPGHPGWAIYPVDSEAFMATGALDSNSQQSEQTLVAPPPPQPHQPGLTPYQQVQAQQRYGAPHPQHQRQGQAQSEGPPVLPPGTSPFAGMPAEGVSMDDGQPPPAQRQRTGTVHARGNGASSSGSSGQPQAAAAVSHVQQVQSKPIPMDAQQAYMHSMFGGNLTPAALSRLSSSGGAAHGNLAGFPSVPGPLASADLEQLLVQHQGEVPSMGTPFQNMSRIGSLGIGKLESMELPGDQVALMLHDLGPDQAALHRVNSGLESMQSIEQALGTMAEQPHAAMDRATEHFWLQAGSQGLPITAAQPKAEPQ